MSDRTLRPRTATKSYAEQAEEDLGNLMTLARESATFQAFKTGLQINSPRRETQNRNSYAKELFMSNDELQTYNTEFNSFLNLMYLHCKRKQSKSKERGTDTISPMQLDAVDSWVWKLFIGMDIRADALTYKDIEKILGDINACDEGTRNALLRQRQTFKQQFLNGAARKTISIDGVEWVIDKRRDLPWMIPVSFHYHNPLAVDPANATTSEMGECGRMVTSNQKLYQTDPYYKNMLRLALKLEKHMLFENLHEDGRVFTSLWHSWQVSCFVWTKPAFQLYSIPYGVLNYNIFVGVPTRLVESNPDKIIIPQFTVMLPLTGEVRPIDHFVHDSYACTHYRTYNQGYSAQDQKKAHLVCTLDMQGKRPGVGNGGFFANTTCIKEPHFILVPNTLGYKQGNIITKADFLYKHNTIIANRNFTGKDINDIDESLRFHASGLTETLHDIGSDLKFMPLEWPYGKYEQGASEFRCQCLTHCIGITDDGKSKIYMGNPAVSNRTDRNWTREMVQSTQDINETKKTYIYQYLDNYRRHSPAMPRGMGAAMGTHVNGANEEDESFENTHVDELNEEDESFEKEYPAIQETFPDSVTGDVSDAVAGIAVDKSAFPKF